MSKAEGLSAAVGAEGGEEIVVEDVCSGLDVKGEQDNCVGMKRGDLD